MAEGRLDMSSTPGPGRITREHYSSSITGVKNLPGVMRTWRQG